MEDASVEENVGGRGPVEKFGEVSGDGGILRVGKAEFL